MRIKASRAGTYLSKPPKDLRAVLLFGNDAGLVAERATALAALVAERADDPFRVADLEAEALRGDPGRLLREAAQAPLTGGQRVVRLRRLPGLEERISGPMLAEYLEAPPAGALLIVEGGDLTAKSALVRSFDSSQAAAAVECYRDEEAALESFIREVLRDGGARASPAALDYLAQQLGGDRQVSRRELDKLLLYMGEGGEVGLEDAMATVGDSSVLSLEEMALAVAAGDAEGALRRLARALAEGTAAIAILRSLARHFDRLHRARCALDRGERAETAMGKLRPPVFWKQKARFERQLEGITTAEAAEAVKVLMETEAACKRTGSLDHLLLEALVLRLALRAARRGR